jgi:putative addiction module killer protein
MVEVCEYLDRGGRSPFAAWSDRLNREAAAKVAAALARIQQGNFSSAKGVGAGVYEYRIDFGPGYRIYFGKDGDTLVNPYWRRDEKTPAGRYRHYTG